MERKQAFWIPGLVLLIIGVFGLLGNFGFLAALSNLMWAVLFALAGFAFLSWFATDRNQWWALIPGFSLFGLGSTILIGNDWGGTLFLAFIGLGFAAISSLSREHWWAIIPAGVMLTLALVTRTGDAGGSVLFLGLAATFAIVWQRSQRWAMYPAIGCLVMAALTANWLNSIWNFVWPLALIGFGAYLLRPHGGGGSIRH
jgi:hypothetical protein